MFQPLDRLGFPGWLSVAPNGRVSNRSPKSVQELQKHRILTEKKFGNRLLYRELDPEDGGKNIDIRYDVQRIE